LELADKSYWDGVWRAATPAPLNLDGARGYANRRFDRLFSEVLHGEVLEVGCANSQWLGHLSERFRMVGLDYSEIGCAHARALAPLAEVECADLFDPPRELLGRFGSVFTLGVVEHFDEPRRAVEALARFLAPEGTLLTVVPNLTGLIGFVEKRINRKVYDLHVPLGVKELADAHAGLHVGWADYFLATNFGVLNLNGVDNAPGRERLIRGLSRLSKLVWAVERRTRPLPATRAFSPYVACVAQMP